MSTSRTISAASFTPTVWRSERGRRGQRGRIAPRIWKSCALAGVVAILATGCGGGKLSADALSKQAESVQSVAAEGAMLARDAAAGKATGTFTHVHSSELAKTASQTVSSLESAQAEPTLEPRRRRLAGIAGDVSRDLGRLGDASKVERRALAVELATAAERSKRLGEELK
jgi:hypothetical protein